jgi:hypothetical protein
VNDPYSLRGVVPIPFISLFTVVYESYISAGIRIGVDCDELFRIYSLIALMTPYFEHGMM